MLEIIIFNIIKYINIIKCINIFKEKYLIILNMLFYYIHIPRTGGTHFIRTLKKNNIEKNVIYPLEHYSSAQKSNYTTDNIIFSYRDPLSHFISELKDTMNERIIKYNNYLKNNNNFEVWMNEKSIEVYKNFTSFDNFLDCLTNRENDKHNIALRCNNLFLECRNYYSFEMFFDSVEKVKKHNKVYAINLLHANSDIKNVLEKITNKIIIVPDKNLSDCGRQLNLVINYDSYINKYESKFKNIFPKEYELYNYFLTIIN